MNMPPPKLTEKEFDSLIARYYREHYVILEKKECGELHIIVVKCKCGAELKETIGYISFHASDWSGCAGQGEAKTFLLYWCPNCEGPPTRTSGCIHKPMFPAMKKQVDTPEKKDEAVMADLYRQMLEK